MTELQDHCKKSDLERACGSEEGTGGVASDRRGRPSSAHKVPATFQGNGGRFEEQIASS
jgi:hypothetical protein